MNSQISSKAEIPNSQFDDTHNLHYSNYVLPHGVEDFRSALDTIYEEFGMKAVDFEDIDEDKNHVLAVFFDGEGREIVVGLGK